MIITLKNPHALMRHQHNFHRFIRLLLNEDLFDLFQLGVGSSHKLGAKGAHTYLTGYDRGSYGVKEPIQLPHKHTSLIEALASTGQKKRKENTS